MIKAIIFDLDGVLIEAKLIHYHALNKALKQYGFEISWNEHLAKYDGLPTNKKLEKLTNEKGLDPNLYNTIWTLKQKETINVIKELIKPEDYTEQKKLLQYLIENGYKVFVASNSITESIRCMLSCSDLIHYVHRYYSNEDVRNPKPHSEIYTKCILDAGINPKEALIIEDSHIGRKSAHESGAQVMGVIGPCEVNISNIQKAINKANEYKIFRPKWQGGQMNVLIPMAGAGSRFQKAGYTFPKPLIDIYNKPMIQVVVENLNIQAQHIFICQKSHYEQYNLHHVLNLISPNCKIIQIDHITEGAACTTLLAKDLINNDSPLLIANSDQYIEWDSNEFLYSCNNDHIDGGILTFDSCFGYRTRIDTKEYGKIPIGKIVNQKLKCSVLSYNIEKNIFEYTPVIDYIRIDGKNQKWKIIQTPRKGRIKVTYDHEFLTNDGWKKIENINQEKILTTYYDLNSQQEEVFIGTMLGDGYISKCYNRTNSGLRFSHSIKQKKWAITKLNIFNNLETKYKENDVSIYKTISCCVKINERFKNERKKWYNDKKIVPNNIKLTPLTIATWYMDDGTLINKKSKNPVPRFGTDNFNEKDIQILQNKFKDINILTYITKSNNKPRLIVSANSSQTFFNMIAPYIIPEMAYKLPLQYRNQCSYKYWNPTNEQKRYYIQILCEDLHKIDSDTKYAFCLETKNHNFIVNNLVAHNCHPKWSYVRLDENGYVTEVKEKKPISNIATVGVYYYKKGSDYVKYAEQMINKNVRVNNEFYVCPVFNEMIQDKKKIKTYHVEKMWGLGTPEDLNYFINDHKEQK